jgi:hypothetical protein
MPSTVYASAKVFLVIEGRAILVWKKFLSAQENKQALINFFGTYLLRIARNNPFVQPGHTLYGTVIDISHLDPQFGRICHSGKEVNTKNNHICIERLDYDLVFLSHLF